MRRTTFPQSGQARELSEESKHKQNQANTSKPSNCQQDKDKDKDKDESSPPTPPRGKKRTHSFVPPTLEEVEAYVRARGSPVDAQKFFDYFSEGKWVDSEGKPVRNWKQKIITWEKHDGGGGRGAAGNAAGEGKKRDWGSLTGVKLD